MARVSLWDEMRKLQDRMDSLFDEFFRKDPFLGASERHLLESPKGAVSTWRQPATDIWETDKEIITEIELPGIPKKDVMVTVTDEGIEVKAEASVEKKDEDKKKGIYRLERSRAGFYRFFSLPKNVDADKAVAEHKDGVLRVTVPKSKIESKKKKLLEIK